MPRGARLRVDHSSSIMHLMNRISGQPGELPFDDVEKEKFFKLAERLSVFYTIEIISLVVMGNHWHAIVRTFPELPTKEDAARRFAALYGEKRAQPDWRRDEIYVPIAERMRDVSCFVKDLQGQFTAWFNKTRPKKRRGSLWAGRFKSILLDDETAVLRCMKYVEMNPVRAGIVADPSDYRFSTFGRLCLAGKTFFKGNMINTLRHKMNFPEEYSDQQILHEFGACLARMAAAERQLDEDEIETAVAEALRGPTFDLVVTRRIRFWTDGAIIGSKTFIRELSTTFFGPERTEKKRFARSTGDAELFALRRLRTID